MPQEIASLYATIGADLTGLTSGLASARGQLTGFQGGMASVGQSMTRIGMGMTAAFTVPLVGAAVSALKTAAGFEAATNIMAIAARQSGTPLETLRQAALAVGKDEQLIGIDAMQASDAMTTFYKTGFTTAEVLGDVNGYLERGTGLTGALRASIDLAAASDLDLAASSDAVAIALKTFNLGASEATNVADSFVGAADASVAEVSDLTQAMYTFGPTANQYGWSLQDTNTALAILADRGILGAEAGTSLRSMMTNMMRDTAETTGALDELNISLYDQNGQMRELPDIIGQLSESFAGLTEEQKNGYIQTLAGTYGMKAMNTLLNEGATGWNEMESAIGNAATAQEVGQKRTEGFAGALEQLGGATQTFMIEAGTPFLDKFATPGAQKITDIVNALSDLSPEQMRQVVDVLLPLAMGGPILLGVGSILSTLAAIPAPLLAAASAAVILGGALWFGSDKGQEFVDNLSALDSLVLKLGGEKARQDWIAARQGIVGAQRTTAGITSGEGTPESRRAAHDVFGYPMEDMGITSIPEAERLSLDTLINELMGPDIGRAYSIENGEIVVTLGVAPDPRLVQVLTALKEGTAPNRGIANIAEELSLLAPPEGFSLPVAFTLAQTPEEIAALAGPLPVLPNEYGGVGVLPYGPKPLQPNGYGGIGSQPYGPEPLPTLEPNTYGGVGAEQYGPEPLPPPGLNVYGGIGSQPYGPEMPTLLDVPFSLTPMQTPEEMAALLQSVLPAEGSLRRGVVLSVVPDRAQIERSASEIAESWAAAVRAKLEGLKQRVRAVPDTFEQDLWTEAQSEGVTP